VPTLAKVVASELDELLDSSLAGRALPEHDDVSLVNGVFVPPVDVQVVPPDGRRRQDERARSVRAVPVITPVSAPSVGVALAQTTSSGKLTRTSRRIVRRDGRRMLGLPGSSRSIVYRLTVRGKDVS